MGTALTELKLEIPIPGTGKASVPPAPLASAPVTRMSRREPVADGEYWPPDAVKPRSPPAVGVTALDPATKSGTYKLAVDGNPEYCTMIRVPVSEKASFG